MNDAYTDMVGMTMKSVVNRDDEVIFTAETGDRFRFYHCQSCCETVEVEDVKGDLQDLVGAPITSIQEKIEEEDDGWGPVTRTTHIIRTKKGKVTISWVGSSNGYYSEDVDFGRLTDPKYGLEDPNR